MFSASGLYRRVMYGRGVVKWDENWQENSKYSQKTFTSGTLSITNPT
jgi:hypothetical protein